MLWRTAKRGTGIKTSRRAELELFILVKLVKKSLVEEVTSDHIRGGNGGGLSEGRVFSEKVSGGGGRSLAVGWRVQWVER